MDEINHREGVRTKRIRNEEWALRLSTCMLFLKMPVIHRFYVFVAVRLLIDFRVAKHCALWIASNLVITATLFRGPSDPYLRETKT